MHGLAQSERHQSIRREKLSQCGGGGAQPGWELRRNCSPLPFLKSAREGQGGSPGGAPRALAASAKPEERPGTQREGGCSPGEGNGSARGSKRNAGGSKRNARGNQIRSRFSPFQGLTPNLDPWLGDGSDPRQRTAPSKAQDVTLECMERRFGERLVDFAPDEAELHCGEVEKASQRRVRFAWRSFARPAPGCDEKGLRTGGHRAPAPHSRLAKGQCHSVRRLARKSSPFVRYGTNACGSSKGSPGWLNLFALDRAADAAPRHPIDCRKAQNEMQLAAQAGGLDVPGRSCLSLNFGFRPFAALP